MANLLKSRFALSTIAIAAVAATAVQIALAEPPLRLPTNFASLPGWLVAPPNPWIALSALAAAVAAWALVRRLLVRTKASPPPTLSLAELCEALELGVLGNPMAEDVDMAARPGETRLWAERRRTFARMGKLARRLILARKLALLRPADVESQLDLSRSHLKFGDAAAQADNLAEALQHYGVSLAIAERLAAFDPAHVPTQNHLAMSHDKLGDMALDRGDSAAARRHYERGLAIVEAQAAADPTSAGWQRNRAVAHSHLGDVALAAGRTAEARRQYEASLAAADQRLQVDPSDSLAQCHRFLVQGVLGQIAVRESDFDEARARFGACLALAEERIAAHPADAENRRDLSLCHELLGGVASATGDCAEARRHFDACLVIREKLAAEPGTALAQQDLAVALFKLGEWEAVERRPEAARQQFERAETILAELRALSPRNASVAQDLATVRAALAVLPRPV